MVLRKRGNRVGKMAPPVKGFATDPITNKIFVECKWASGMENSDFMSRTAYLNIYFPAALTVVPKMAV